MRKDKKEAIHLRKKGKSYNQIASALKISKSTLSDWFSGIQWSDLIKKRLVKSSQQYNIARLRELDRVRGKHLARAYKEARIEARNELEQLTYHPLFIAGVMLYWGEGDKRNRHHVRLTNTDPEMIRLFVHFLKRLCRIPEAKIRASVLIYPDLKRLSDIGQKPPVCRW